VEGDVTIFTCIEEDEGRVVQDIYHKGHECAIEHVTDRSYLSCMCREKPFAVCKWLDNFCQSPFCTFLSLFRLLTERSSTAVDRPYAFEC
jgi:hypothetical protein